MEHNPIITLTTDFGYRDPFVGIMKGVILGLNPSATIVDITHNITPQNVLEAAIMIEMSFESFPPRTIHIVVVDPGVGSLRRPILVIADRYFFIGPDNGVFSQIYRLQHEILRILHITSEHYFTHPISSTFHGRDVFAPVAGWLSRGIEVSKFGVPIDDYTSIKMPVPVMPAKNIIEGEVLYIDRFGNAVSNIVNQEIDHIRSNNPEGRLKVLVKGKEAPLMDYYAQAEVAGLFSLINSFNYLEIFVYKGSASSDYGIGVGEKVGVIVK